jgi:hypothetical protein
MIIKIFDTIIYIDNVLINYFLKINLFLKNTILSFILIVNFSIS